MDGPCKFLPIPARPARVWVKHMETGVGQRHHLDPRGWAMRRVRPTMNVNDDRTRTRRISTLDQPGIKLMALGVINGIAYRILAKCLQPLRAILGQYPSL